MTQHLLKQEEAAALLLATPLTTSSPMPLPDWHRRPDRDIVRHGSVAHWAAIDGSPIYTPFD